MIRTTCTSMCSAVLLSFLLAAAVGSPTQPHRNIQDPLKGMQPLGVVTPTIPATEADLLSHKEPDGVTVVKGNHDVSGKKVSRRSLAPLFKPQVDEFLLPVPVARHSPGYFAKHVPFSKKAGGCEVTSPATEVANFSQECQNLLSRCSMVLDMVERLDKCSHLKSGRTVTLDNEEPEAQPVETEKDHKPVVALGKNVEMPVGELDAKLAQLSMELDSQKNKLVDLGQQLNHFHDALQEKFAAAAASTLRYLEGNSREVKALLNEKTDSMMTTMSSVLSMVVINPKAHRWNFTGYAGHKADAIKKGWFWELGAKVYLQHYLIYWGIEMKAENGDVSLYLLFQLHKGRNDDFLDWPFSNKLKLCLIHPETQQEHCGSYQPDIASVNNKFFARPLKDSKERVYFPSTKTESKYIEKNGFIKEDKLLLKLEVLS